MKYYRMPPLLHKNSPDNSIHTIQPGRLSINVCLPARIVKVAKHQDAGRVRMCLNNYLTGPILLN